MNGNDQYTWAARWLFVATCLVYVHTQAASIDCEKRLSTPVEDMICHDNDLEWQDIELNRLYLDVLDASREPGKVRQQQRRWLKRRDTCEDRSCIEKAYNQRAAELQASPEMTALRALETDAEKKADALGVETIDRPVWHNLQRLLWQVRQAERVRVRVFRPSLQFETVKRCSEGRCRMDIAGEITTPRRICNDKLVQGSGLKSRSQCGFVHEVSKARSDEEAGKMQLCSGLLNALQNDQVRLPRPVARMTGEEDLEPYWQRVTGLAQEYWKVREPRLLARLRSRAQVDQEAAPEEKAQKDLAYVRGKTLDRYLLDRQAYGPHSLLILGVDTWEGRTPTPHPPMVQALYENGVAADGRARYLEMRYFHKAEGSIGKRLIKTISIDLTTDRGLGHADSAGPGLGIKSDRYIALGLLGYDGHVLPWKLLAYTDRHDPVPGDWRYYVKIDTDLPDGGAGKDRDPSTEWTCSYYFN
jgi:uncharacterized protein YecT (DUF1311 family)